MTAKLAETMIEDGVLDAKLDKAGGTMTGDLTLAGAPSSPLHAATKGYVDGLTGAPRGHFSGLTLSNNTTDANNDIDVGAGEAASDDSSPVLIAFASSITKRLDAAWAVGTGNGGLDTGSKANSTWYYVWLIMRSDTGVVDVLFSTSATSPTMPTDYDQKVLINAILTDGSGNIRPFKDRGGGRIDWVTRVKDFAAAAVGTSGSLGALSVPRIAGTFAHATFGVYYGSASSYFLATAADETDSAPDNSLYDALVNSTLAFETFGREIRVNSSGQIRMRVSHASATVDVFTRGWTLRRAS